MADSKRCEVSSKKISVIFLSKLNFHFPSNQLDLLCYIIFTKEYLFCRGRSLKKVADSELFILREVLFFLRPQLSSQGLAVV